MLTCSLRWKGGLGHGAIGETEPTGLALACHVLLVSLHLLSLVRWGPALPVLFTSVSLLLRTVLAVSVLFF